MSHPFRRYRDHRESRRRELELVARHEAAHAVVAASLGRTIESVAVVHALPGPCGFMFEAELGPTDDRDDVTVAVAGIAEELLDAYRWGGRNGVASAIEPSSAREEWRGDFEEAVWSGVPIHRHLWEAVAVLHANHASVDALARAVLRGRLPGQYTEGKIAEADLLEPHMPARTTGVMGDRISALLSIRGCNAEAFDVADRVIGVHREALFDFDVEVSTIFAESTERFDHAHALLETHEAKLLTDAELVRALVEISPERRDVLWAPDGIAAIDALDSLDDGVLRSQILTAMTAAGHRAAHIYLEGAQN